MKKKRAGYAKKKGGPARLPRKARVRQKGGEGKGRGREKKKTCSPAIEGRLLAAQKKKKSAFAALREGKPKGGTSRSEQKEKKEGRTSHRRGEKKRKPFSHVLWEKGKGQGD